MYSNLIKHRETFFLFLLLIVFIVLKHSDLYLPYFWDELGVYSQASLYLTDHTLSILPNSIPPELSRGHPLLFMFLYGCVFKIFGTSVFVAHTFSLVISLAFVSIAYLLFKLYVSKTLSLIGVALLIFQPIFFLQSTFVLPEIMLGVFSLSALYFYLHKKIVLTVVFTVCAVFVKETGLLLPVVFIASAMYSNKWDKGLIVKILLFSIPFVAFGIFIFIQKIQNGWYFFPYHTGFLKFETLSIFHRGADLMDFILFKQGRKWYTLLMLFVVIVMIFKQRLSNTFTVTIQTFDAFIPLVLMLLGAMLFSSLNFHMVRYQLFIYPIFIVLLLSISISLIKTEWILAVALIAILSNQFKYMKHESRLTENDRSCIDYIQAHKNTCIFIEKTIPANKRIYSIFPFAPAFYDTRLGYFENKKYTVCENDNEATNCDYAVYSKPGNLEWLSLPKNKTVLHYEKIGLAEIYLIRMK